MKMGRMNKIINYELRKMTANDHADRRFVPLADGAFRAERYFETPLGRAPVSKFDGFKLEDDR